jgi:hypothetical protein
MQIIKSISLKSTWDACKIFLTGSVTFLEFFNNKGGEAKLVYNVTIKGQIKTYMCNNMHYLIPKKQ